LRRNRRKSALLDKKKLFLHSEFELIHTAKSREAELIYERRWTFLS
jgi:hypothetical protein